MHPHRCSFWSSPQLHLCPLHFQEVFFVLDRNGVLIINACAFVVGGLIYIENFYSLLVFRLLQGVFVGMYSSVTPIMIK
jgi:hypothetical protein